MKKIELGHICADCFNAVNYNLAQLSAEELERARFVGHFVSDRADEAGVTSLHTGESIGFSHAPCDCCNSVLAGDRWPLMGLKQTRKDYL